MRFIRIRRYCVLICLLLHYATAFVAVKQKPKGALTQNTQRRRQGQDTDDLTEYEESSDPHQRLADFIRAMARPFHLPIKHPKKSIDIHVSAGLYQIVDLDQRNNLATLSAYFDVWWMDEFVVWNASDFSGISRIFVPHRWIWKPEFYMYHSIHGRTPDYAIDATAEIRSDGKIRMFVPITSRSICAVNVKYFPFDTQQCSFSCGSWTYQREFVRLQVEQNEIFLGDFYDNQEWLLIDAHLHNGTTRHLSAEAFSMVYMNVELKRQSFYYVFNLVFPTTLVSIVAVIGFHAPINATGRRESKFRLGIMTLLSMSVMLLMLVGEMKFAMESVPGQRGSFSDVPLLGIYYMTLILIISVATCTSSIFVHLEKFALRNPTYQSVPWYLRWLAAKKLFCCYVPKHFRYAKNEAVMRNNNIQAISMHSSPDNTLMRNLIPTEVSFTEVNQDAPLHADVVLEGHTVSHQKLDLLVSLLRECLSLKEAAARKNVLAPFWERIVGRLEKVSLTFYLSLIAFNLTLFLYPEVWY